MDKSLVGHAALAVIAVGIAYAAWQKPAESPKATVVVVSGSADRLTQVEWDEPTFHVTLDRHGDAMTVTSTAKGDTPDRHNVSEFPMNDKGRELVTRLAPFKAERSLGKPDATRQKEIGLETPTQSLTLHFGERTTKLDVGDATFGTTSYYVRDQNGEVFLMPALTITQLKNGGTSIVERMVVNLTREHVEQISIKTDTIARTLVQKNAGERAQSFFADVTSPDAKIAKASGWVDSVLRLRVLSAAAEVPTTEAKLQVVIHGDDGRERIVKVWEPTVETAVVVSTIFPKGVLVARSAAELLIKDAAQVLADGGNQAGQSDAHAEAR